MIPNPEPIATVGVRMKSPATVNVTSDRRLSVGAFVTPVKSTDDADAGVFTVTGPVPAANDCASIWTSVLRPGTLRPPGAPPVVAVQWFALSLQSPLPPTQ